MPTAMSGWIPVSTQATTIATPRHPSLPTPTRRASTTPALPWHTTPTPPHAGAPQPTHTATSRTLGVTRGTAGTGTSGAHEDIPDAFSRLRPSHLNGVPRLTDLHLGAYTPAPPLEDGAWCPCQPRTRPSSSRLHTPTTCGVHYYLVCTGADSWPLDTLSLVGAVHCIHVWISPDTILSQRHAARLPHPARAPPCCPPTVLAQPRLCHGHRPHRCQSPGAGGHIPTPTFAKIGPGPTPRPSYGRAPQATLAPPRR